MKPIGSTAPGQITNKLEELTQNVVSSLYLGFGLYFLVLGYNFGFWAIILGFGL